MTNTGLLSMGQDLSIISDEINKGSKALANLQADIEDIDMFGKDKNNVVYVSENMKSLNAFTATMDERIAELKALKTKFEEAVKETQTFIDNYSKHIYSK